MSTGALTVRVTRKEMEALDICTFELVEVSGRPLPPFSAGSHVDVKLPNGLTRQYSLCNDPAESHRYLIGVLKDSKSRGGSKTMHEMVKEGDLIQISAPKNHFPLVHGAARSLLLAGGIGVTPILCMAERLTNAGEEFEMHYCTRALERTAFHRRISTSTYASRVRFHFDAGPVEQKFDAAALLASPQPDVHVYVCGPKGFMDWILETARNTGWPSTQLHHEFFSGEVAQSNANEAFEVKIASSGRIVVVPKAKTVAQALAEAGVEIQTSCEQGVCGTCLTRVLDGVPDHRDLYLTTEERKVNDQFLPCCSRAKSRLIVLDL